METTYDYTERTCGIVATIKIGCSDERELLLHLTVLRQQIKKRLKANPDLNPETFKVEDNNCYGVHEAEVILYPE